MKRKNIFITALLLLSFSSTAMAQEQIKNLFQEIGQCAGVTHIGEQKASSTDSAGFTSESCITIIKIKKADFPALFNRLKETFDRESRHASMMYTHTGDNENNGSDTGFSMSPRQQWSIWRDGASPILVGSVKNSNYLMANFDDRDHPGFRTCYVVEWSDTEDPGERMAKLIYVYGHKPAMQTNSQLINYQGTATWPGDLKIVTGRSSNLLIPDSLKQWLLDRRSLRDSLFTMKMETLEPLLGKTRDIPLNGDLTEWMNKAMNNVKHLSSSDWHRVFGLLTQQMIDRADKKSSEDQVVAAGIILDLCKNASQLDADERQVSARRLEQVAATLKSNPYVHDLLMLGAKKLRQK